jgi:Subunit ChlI of Mg-chelatase
VRQGSNRSFHRAARPFPGVAAAAATLTGAADRPVSVEVHVSNGLPGFTIVGLPDAGVRESNDRVRAALLSNGLAWPPAFLIRRFRTQTESAGIPWQLLGTDRPPPSWCDRAER